MDIHAKVKLLGAASEFDICSSSQAGGSSERYRELSQSISHVLLPGGRRTRLLKVLLSNICENDCAYCAIRASRDVRRTAFTPDELAGCFDQMHRAGLVDGLFLSSGICRHAIREMDRMIATVEIVRSRYQFEGYVHLKLLPGVTADQVERAVQLGDRVSVNLEAPTAERLARLSARKGFGTELMPTLQIASHLIRAAGQHTKATSVTTQFVVGAAEESDREILSTSSRLYRTLGLARTYYSAFTPIPDTPLAGHDPTPPLRQHRLYQSDFLLRQYGFEFGDLVFDGGGNLPAECDPKVAWARGASGDISGRSKSRQPAGIAAGAGNWPGGGGSHPSGAASRPADRSLPVAEAGGQGGPHGGVRIVGWPAAGISDVYVGYRLMHMTEFTLTPAEPFDFWAIIDSHGWVQLSPLFLGCGGGRPVAARARGGRRRGDAPARQRHPGAAGMSARGGDARRRVDGYGHRLLAGACLSLPESDARFERVSSVVPECAGIRERVGPGQGPPAVGQHAFRGRRQDDLDHQCQLGRHQTHGRPIGGCLWITPAVGRRPARLSDRRADRRWSGRDTGEWPWTWLSRPPTSWIWPAEYAMGTSICRDGKMASSIRTSCTRSCVRSKALAIMRHRAS